MLLQLNIKDFAIIDNLQISFGSGLNILTGETGAGKSIIVDAVKLILGDRASVDDIRSSKEEAVVEAMFDVSSINEVSALLSERGIAVDESLIIRRIISRSGRNRIFINSSMANLSMLQELGGRIIDIYGQHDHQSLTRPEEHIGILDSFAGLVPLRHEYSAAFDDFSSVKSELENLKKDGQRLLEQRDYLAFQSQEIEAANLRSGEDEELKKKKELLANAEKLFNAANSGQDILYSSSGSVSERIGQAIARLKDAARFDERLNKTIESIEGAACQIDDAAMFLRDYAGNINFEPGLIDEIDDRLDAINKLRKKYGATVEAVLKKKAEIDIELNNIINHDERIAELEKRLDVARSNAFAAAAGLSEKRGEAAGLLQRKMEQELAGLGMKKTQFNARIQKCADEKGDSLLTENGIDRVEFFISPNPGEEPKPLARIASGGELSRIMLAIKKITTTGKIPVLVFDEVDAGIGGGIAEIVGKRLKEISNKHQVLCITHLPQIAAYADKHYTVSKETRGGKTLVTARELEGDARITELARMLGGVKITDTTKEHAVEMLQNARI